MRSVCLPASPKQGTTTIPGIEQPSPTALRKYGRATQLIGLRLLDDEKLKRRTWLSKEAIETHVIELVSADQDRHVSDDVVTLNIRELGVPVLEKVPSATLKLRKSLTTFMSKRGRPFREMGVSLGGISRVESQASRQKAKYLNQSGTLSTGLASFACTKTRIPREDAETMVSLESSAPKRAFSVILKEKTESPTNRAWENVNKTSDERGCLAESEHLPRFRPKAGQTKEADRVETPRHRATLPGERRNRVDKTKCPERKSAA